MAREMLGELSSAMAPIFRSTPSLKKELLPRYEDRVSSSTHILPPRPLSPDVVDDARPSSASSEPLRSSPLRSPTSSARTAARIRKSGSFDPDFHELARLKHRETDLQKQLQNYLDTQADALALGATENAAVEASRKSPQPPNVSKEPPASLQSVRSGILDTMVALSDVTRSQSQIIGKHTRVLQTTAEQLASWDVKRSRLKQKIGALSGNTYRDDTGQEEAAHLSPEESQSLRDVNQAEKLRQEDSVLQEQIEAMEVQLAELRSQQRAVKAELGRLENANRARVSSYEGSLEIMEKDIQTFLDRPTGFWILPAEANSEGVETKYERFISLPRDRRTLEMAVDAARENKQAISLERRKAQREVEALRHGIELWESVTSQVVAFERKLKSNITRLSASTSQETNEHNLTRLRRQLLQLIKTLEHDVDAAEQRGWNLLVCCIGAELEALRQGQRILSEMTGVSEGNDDSLATPDENSDGFVSPAFERHGPILSSTSARSGSSGQAGEKLPEAAEPMPGGNTPARDLRRQGKQYNIPLATPTRAQRYRDIPEDDEPDPDLMVSKTETDTEPEDS